MSTSNGWIKLHRKIIESPIFDNEKLLRVWIWCLCKANHDDDKVLVGLREIEVRQGQFMLGLPAASSELNVPQTTLKRYFDSLEKMGMLTRKSENKYSLITVENWRVYQVNTEDSGKQVETKWKPNGNQTETNKNDKNVKNDKNIYISRAREEKNHSAKGIKGFGVMGNVMLTEEQRKSLFDTYESSGKLIDKVSVWLPEHPRKNHYATCLTFAQNADWKKKQPPKPPEPPEPPSVPMPDDLRDKFRTKKPYREVPK